MPCDSIVLNKVELGKTNPDLLVAALREMGALQINARTGALDFMADGRRYAIQQGQLVGDQRTVGEMADRVKRAYAGAAVKQAAKRYGWTVKQTAANKFAVTKR